MKKFLVPVISIFAAVGIVAAQCAPPAKRPDPRHDNAQYDVAAMFKMHVNPVTPQFTTGAQPTPEILKEFKGKGYKAVINLRPPREHDAAGEEAAATALGLRYFNIPVIYPEPKFEQADEFLKLTDDPANRPALIHCTMNIRAGAFWMIRRILRDGWKFEDALKEAERGAGIAPHYQKFVRDYVTRQKNPPGSGDAPAASAQSAPMLVSTELLTQKIAQRAPLVILHVGTQADYDAGHIPGAQLVAREHFVESQDAAGRAGEMKPPEELTDWARNLGITEKSHVVAYMGANLITLTTRIFLTMEMLGVRNVSVLDGGFPVWKAENRAISTESFAAKKSDFVPRLDSEIVVTADWVKDNLASAAVTLVDARNRPFYTGENDAQGRIPRPGHIPGALSLPYVDLLEENGKFKNIDTLRSLFEQAGVKPDAKVVTYCHTGFQATVGYSRRACWAIRPACTTAPTANGTCAPTCRWKSLRSPPPKKKRLLLRANWRKEQP